MLNSRIVNPRVLAQNWRQSWMSDAPAPDVPPTTKQHRHASLDDFLIGEEIAWGSLATIVEATHKTTNKRYVIKILDKLQLVKKKMTHSVLAEKEALVKLASRPQPHHPGIIRLHYSFHDASSLYFVLDLAPNGDLKQLVQKTGSLAMPCARYYTAQLTSAIQYLHEAGVSHRDIKPENALLDESMRIKIADFGCAYVSADLDTHRTNTFVGTAAYISPELLLRAKADPKGPDLWALGCTLHFLLFARYPFSAATEYLTMERVKKLDYSIPEGCDPVAHDLIKRLLVPFEDRIGLSSHSSPAELRNHAFFIGPDDSEPSSCGNEGYIDWATLWTIPVPKIVAGPFKPNNISEEDTVDLLWSRFEDISLSGA